MIVAVLDACVLYPPSLRDLLMRLATGGVYVPRWTNAIQAEWVRSVLEDSPAVSEDQLARTCRLMEQANPDGLVSGYEVHISTIILPDAEDRHVLAAAIHAFASRIVTYNLSDFPNSALEHHGVKAVHPDAFLSALVDEEPTPFLNATRRHRAALKNPSKTAQGYIDTLRANRLDDLALRLEAYREQI